MHNIKASEPVASGQLLLCEDLLFALNEVAKLSVALIYDLPPDLLVRICTSLFHLI